MKSYLPPAFVVLALITACGGPAPGDGPAVLPGVSLTLAEHRGDTISGVHYTLAFEIPGDVNAAIAGHAEIRFTLGDNTSPVQIDFRERAENIHAVAVNDDATAYDFLDEHIVIPANSFVDGENVIAIEFTAGNSSLNRNPDYLYTLFVPDRARTAFPLFDQPDLKATYALTLRVPPGWTAISSAPEDRVHYGADWTEFRFQRSDLVSSYLFSFVAGRFERVSREIGGRHMTMLHRETDAAKVARNLDEIFSLHAAAIDWLEDYTGQAYPFAKFGFVLIPDFQYGGMEHVGAIQYRASSLLLDEAPSQTRLLGRAGLIAHETAHMWFGNLVTMAWFNDVWTKEVFANFMAAKIVNPSFPEVNHDLNFLVSHYPQAYSVDRTAGANPIRQYLPNLNEAGQMYGAIIYDKAPIMMRQLEFLIGAEAFRDGLREYLETFAFGNATWPALVDILDQRSDEDVVAWSRVWVETPGREAIQARWQRGDDHGDPAFRYGLVPVGAATLVDMEALDEVSRAATLVNAYENVVAGIGPAPADYFARLVDVIAVEENELVLDLALDQLGTLYWVFLPESARSRLAPLVESVLWEEMQAASDPARQKLWFMAYSNMALTDGAVGNVHAAWSGDGPVAGVPLSENELIDLALELAVKLPKEAGSIVAAELGRIENPDNRRRLEFVAPSLSADEAVRDAFFASLADEANRQTESWVLDALAALHHPLRVSQSGKYILPSLELLTEIQATGDIFFPKRWLDGTLRSHQDASAAATVRAFLDERPGYNEQLRMKILQSAHLLFRASEMLADSGQADR